MFTLPYSEGAAERDFGRLTLQQLHLRLVNAELLSDKEIDHFVALTHDPTFAYIPLLMVTARGRRPATATAPPGE